MYFAKIKKISLNVFNDFFDDEITTRSAALAFYTSLALAPLVILTIVILGALGIDLQKEFVTEVAQTIGDDSAKLLQTIISAANERPDLKSVSGIFAGIGLLASASFIFVQLQETLNLIFDVEKKDQTAASRTQIVKDFITIRLFSIGMLMAFIFVLIASLAVSTLISLWSSGEATAIYLIIHNFASFFIFAILFGGIYKWMPDRKISFRHALYGGGITAFLFMIGKILIGLYISGSAAGSAYGAAGSLLVTLLWVYYSGLVMLIGAEVAYAAILESPAEAAKKEEVARTRA